LGTEEDGLKRTEELVRRLEEERTEFILTELQMATTFLDVAETTKSASTAVRNCQNAQKAVDTAKHFLSENRPLSESARINIAELLEDLEQRLALLRRHLLQGI